MNSPYIPSDINRNKSRKWIANHLGSFLQKGSHKDSVNNAFVELSMQLSDGRFRELQCTIEIDRDKKTISIKRWLDNVMLEEFNLMSITNVQSMQQVPQNKTLSNIVIFTTQTKNKDVIITETHIFHLEDINTANYLASDIRSAIEACTTLLNNNNPIKVLPSMSRESTGKFSNFEAVQQTEDITSKTERNLLLLNYCFDDIEFFLQHLKDQEEARALLASNKSRMSDRLLEGKAKPSTLSAYLACIQKIKFSLNLLSKLDGKIKNPDSHQLSVLLMENLVKIGQAYGIYHNGKINKVKEPLLTDDTIKMLQVSLTKHYYKVLNGWGECWIKPREKWSGYQEKYYPEFFNGYQIDVDDLVKDGIISPSVEQPKVAMNNSGINQLIFSNLNISSISPSSSNGKGPSNQREEDFCRSVLLKGGRLYKVINTFIASKDQELSMSEGDIIEVIESRPDKSWWLCGNMQGQRGYSPCTVIEPFHYIDRSINNEGATSPLPDNAQQMLNSSRNSRNRPLSTTSQRETVTLEKSLEEAKAINEELKLKINSTSTFGNPLARASFARPGPVVSKKHGQLSINQDSTNSDVQNWLKFKKFSDEDCGKLKDFTGQTLFLLSRDQMNRIVGVDVAARLDSFIKVQKSMSGFGTLSRKELNEILTKRKNQVEFEESF